jgi:hypothetical protein
MGIQRNNWTLRGLFSDFFTYKGTLDVASLVDAAGATSAITVTGVALGDIVIGLSFGVDLQGMVVTAYVSAANTVSVRVQNEAASTIDLASTTIQILVGRPATNAFI